MTKTEYVTVRLTRLEAEALVAAANNSLASVEDAYAVLLTKPRVAAGFRSLAKMRAAIWGKNHG
jgi:hypothetical protein